MGDDLTLVLNVRGWLEYDLGVPVVRYFGCFHGFFVVSQRLELDGMTGLVELGNSGHRSSPSHEKSHTFDIFACRG